MAPSVSYDKRIDFTKSSMKIRGIGTLVFGAGVEPSVATFVDGVVMARGGAGFFELSDVEQIEVLLGPQGTLFGKNASAGLIHVITKKPTFKTTQSQLDLRIAENQDYRAVYTISGPINSNLTYRINTYARRYDGNVTNIFNNKSLNGVDAEGLRTKLNWLSDQDTDVLLSFDYSKQASSQGVRVLRVDSETVLLDPAAIGSSGPAGTAGEITGIAGDKNNSLVNLNRDPLTTSEAYGLSLEVNFPWQNHTLTSLSAYREWQQRSDRDNDQTQLDFSLIQRENRDVDWFSQEFRITSALNDRYDYVAGLYYYQSDTFQNSGDSRTLSNPDYVYEYNMAKNNIINTNIAAFSQFNWHHTPSLTSFYGLRYLYDKVEADLSRVAYTQNNSYLGDGQITAVRDVAGLSNADSTRKLIGKIGAKYNISSDIMSYISWSTGFKGAAFNTSFKFDPNTFVNEEPTKPEESKTLEIGLRSLWLDSRLRLDATLFRTNYKPKNLS
jgi:iron complex outermembrane receptor protein